MRPITTGAVLFAGAILTLAAAACGGDAYGGGATAKTTASAVPTRAVAATPAAAGGKTTVDVAAADFSFNPTTFTVAAGEDVTMTLKNGGAARHTLTVYRGTDFTDPVQGAETGTVSAGSKGSFTATFGAGKYRFRCEIHPALMQGEFEAE